MAIDYKWTWGPMVIQDTEELKGVVTGIHWMCIGIDRDTGTQGKNSGLLSAPVVDPANFVTIDSLTNAIVQSWIDQGFDKSAIEAECAGFIIQQVQPTTWSMPIPE